MLSYIFSLSPAGLREMAKGDDEERPAMTPPAQPRLLVLLIFALLTISTTLAFPLDLDSRAALTNTNLTLPFASNSTNLSQSPSSSLTAPIIHYIPNTWPILILHIEPVPFPTRLNAAVISILMSGAISYQQHYMALHHLTRSSPYPDRYDFGISTAFTLQACDMGSSGSPNPWKLGDLLDVMYGMTQVVNLIQWESGISVFRSLGGGASEEVAAGALYKDLPGEDGGVTAVARDVGAATCAYGRGGGGGSVGGSAPQLTG